MTTDITPATKIALLKHLASGKGLDVVATITHLTRDQVLDVASHHGYPDTEKLSWAADILEQKLDDAAAIPDRTAAAQQQARTERPAVTISTPSTPPASVGSSVTLTQPDDIRVLLNTAKGHESKRIQRAADKVIDDLDRLRTMLREDQAKHAARRKADREKAEAKAEVDRLEAQLAQAKAKLRGNTAPKTKKSATAPDDGPTAAEIRAWAAENDVDCPAVGRVPSSVREAYASAHPEAA